MYKYDADLIEPYDTSLNSLIHEQSFLNILVPPLYKKLDVIRINGNMAAHNPLRISKDDALKTIAELFHFLYWIYRSYTEDPDLTIRFDIKQIPAKSKEQEEIERLKKIIEEQNAINITRED